MASNIKRYISPGRLVAENSNSLTTEIASIAVANPMTTLGDILYTDANPATARLGGNTTTTKKYLSQTGDGAASAVPAWSTVSNLNTTAAPAASGDVKIDTDDLKWFGTGAQTAQKVGDSVTNWIHRVQLGALNVSSNGTVALARNAQGDWSLNQTAGGAETTYVAAAVPALRTAAGKGLKLTGVQIAYELGVVDATSIDLVVDGVTYAQATNPVVATHGGAVVDGDYDSNHNTANKRKDSTVANGEHLMTLTLNTPAFNVTAGVEIVVELAAVLANTGTLKVRAFSFLYTEVDS